MRKGIENVELLCAEYPCLGRPSPGAMVIMMTVVIKLLQMAMANGNGNSNDKMNSTMPHTMTIAIQTMVTMAINVHYNIENNE